MRAMFYAAFVAAFLLIANWSGRESGDSRVHPRGPQGSTSGTKPTVYVSDFEIDVVPTAGGGGKRAQGSAPSAPQATRPNSEEDTRKRASQLVELMSTKLMAALQKAGYSAVRMRRGEGRPENGVQIRGLFAEVDSENHWRRAVIHSADDSGKMQVLVTVANLAKPEQKLYEIAQLPGNPPGPGAVITLSPYAPVEKFDVTKDANEDVFQKIAPRIVDDLTALLNANPAAMSP